jgi:2-keto-4-pentenoate hydratase/2-oxohepta-3-ene-1,7-dioic acid hydratase in catechol pathway
MIRPLESELDYEGEMAVIIGKAGRRIRARRRSRMCGYACYTTAASATGSATPPSRPAKFRRHRWIRSLDGHDGRNSRHQQGDHRHRLNGVEVAAPISDLVFDVPALIAYCSTFTELVPGDVIVTGTTGGVGAYRTPPLWMKDGDVVEVEVSGIGVLRNPVKDEAAAAATRAA